MEKEFIFNRLRSLIPKRHVRTLIIAASVFLFLNACVTLSSYQGATLLRLHAQIEIDVPISETFDFVTNTENDHLWRREVMGITSDGPLRVGTVITERVALGTVRGYVTRVRVTKITSPTHLHVETLPDQPRRFIGERNFVPLNTTQTRFIYLILADTRIISDLWPAPVPPGFAKEYFEARMRANLNTLKKLLEAR